MAKVSFIGLGIMGSGMVSNLVKAGHDVTVWNRSASKYGEIEKIGAKTVSDPTELIPGADFLMYCLADDAAVEAIFLKGPSLASKVEKGTIVIDLSTIDPETSAVERKIYEDRGISFLDAPVFGTKGEARDGGLWIVIGGSKDVFDQSLKVLEPISETRHYMGEGGNGTKMKLVGNLLVASQIVSIGEALSLAKKAGLNLTTVLEVAAVADFKTPIYAGVGAGVIKGDYEVNFPLKLMLKDAKLIQAFANRLDSPVSIAITTEELAKEGVDAGMGELNASAIVKVISNRAGVDLSE
ncbi:NAD(P)-dependent oxidoreductase [Actinobacteria bacterium IMCC25003]|nr:NAD(P)-dependent oxidoreductase [Actinobacteria bacterium IMCC25003]